MALAVLDLQPVVGSKFLKLRADRRATDRLVDQRAEERRRLAAIEIEQHRLHRPHCGWHERERPIAYGRKRERADRLRRQLATYGRRFFVLMSLIGDVFERAQD